MSTCISTHGEFSSHDIDENFLCRSCGVLDEDALRDDRVRLLAEIERLRAGLYPLSQFTPESSAALADDIGASEDSLFVGWIRRGSEIEAAHNRISRALTFIDRPIPEERDRTGGSSEYWRGALDVREDMSGHLRAILTEATS